MFVLGAAAVDVPRNETTCCDTCPAVGAVNTVLFANENAIEPIESDTAPPASVYAAVTPTTRIIAVCGISSNPAPGAATNVTGVVCNKTICALVNVTSATCIG